MACNTLYASNHPQVESLRHLIRRDLNHRAGIHLPRIDIIVDNSKQHDRARHQTAKIHVRGVGIDRLREEAEDEDYDPVSDPEGIEQYTPDTGDVEGAPDEFVGVPRGTRHLGGVQDVASDAVPEQEGFGEHVGCVETAHAEGNDVVEGGGGANVYEADGAGDAGHDHDGVHGDGGVGLDLFWCSPP